MLTKREREREESSDGDEGGWEGQGNHQGKARPVKASGGQPASPLQRSPPQLSTSTNKLVPSKFIRPQQQQRVGRTAIKCANRLDDDEPDAVRASSSSVGVKNCIRNTDMSLIPREYMFSICCYLVAVSSLPAVGDFNSTSLDNIHNVAKLTATQIRARDFRSKKKAVNMFTSSFRLVCLSIIIIILHNSHVPL